MKERLTKIRQILKEQQLDAVITGKAVNRLYLSGFTGSAGWVIVSQEQAVLVTDFRYVEQAQAEAPHFTIVNHERDVKGTLLRQLQGMGVKRLAFEKHDLRYAVVEEWQAGFTGIELVPTEGLIEQLRLRKDDSEMALIREAVRIADEAFTHILSYVKPGVREQEVALELEYFMKRSGAESAAFEIIVASGERGALPHGRASERKIQAGDMVTFDFGARYKGYVSDLTRTVAVGEPKLQLKKIYEIVLRAQQHAVDQIRAGMTGREADALARDIIAEAGYAAAFGHSTGHGIGLEVHEGPSLAMSSDTVLQPGMVVTVEPGIYIPGLGGVRIEDDVLITESGCEILTQSTKELLILPL